MVSAVVDRGNGGPREWRTWTVYPVPVTRTWAAGIGSRQYLPGHPIALVHWLLKDMASQDTASEMTYTVSGGALNSTQSSPKIQVRHPYEIDSCKCKNIWLLYEKVVKDW